MKMEPGFSHEGHVSGANIPCQWFRALPKSQRALVRVDPSLIWNGDCCVD